MKDDHKDKYEDASDGMIRKTRRVRKKRRATSNQSEKDAGSLFSKAKDLLIGMHDEEEDYGPVDVAEQMRRLKKRKGDDDKPLDEVWGTKKRSASWLWIVLIGIIAPVVAIIIGITKLGDNSDYDSGLVDKSKLTEIQAVEFDPGEGPLGWYQASSVKVTDEVMRVIDAINDAKVPEEIEGLTRMSPFRKINPINLSDWGKPLLTNSLSGFQWEPLLVSQPGSASERGFLEVTGTRVDGEPYKIYFVHEDGRVVLDWDASTSWSEMGIGEMAEQRPRKETFIRCLLEKRPVYDLKFGDVEYSGFFLSSPDRTERLIAYVPLNNERNRQIDRDLKAALNYGSFITGMPLLKNVRVTLKVRHRSDLGESGIFEISEFEHAGWVRP